MKHDLANHQQHSLSTNNHVIRSETVFSFQRKEWWLVVFSNNAAGKIWPTSLAPLRGTSWGMGCTAKVDQTWPNMGCSTNNKRQILRDRAKEVLKQQAQELAVTWNTTSPNNFPTMGNVIGKLTSMSLALQMWVQTVCWNRCSGSVSGLSIRLGLLRLLSCTFVVSRRPHWILDQKRWISRCSNYSIIDLSQGWRAPMNKTSSLAMMIDPVSSVPGMFIHRLSQQRKSGRTWSDKSEPVRICVKQPCSTAERNAQWMRRFCLTAGLAASWERSHVSGPLTGGMFMTPVYFQSRDERKDPPEDYRDEQSWVGVWQEVRTATNIHCGHWCILCVAHIYIYIYYFIYTHIYVYIYVYTYTYSVYVCIHTFI